MRAGLGSVADLATRLLARLLAAVDVVESGIVVVDDWGVGWEHDGFDVLLDVGLALLGVGGRAGSGSGSGGGLLRGSLRLVLLVGGQVDHGDHGQRHVGLLLSWSGLGGLVWNRVGESVGGSLLEDWACGIDWGGHGAELP